MSGCGNSKDKSVEDVSPVIDSVKNEEAEDENTINVETENSEELEKEESVESEANGETTETELVIDETLLERPLPETVDEVYEIAKQIKDGKLLNDYLESLAIAIDNVESNISTDEFLDKNAEFLKYLEGEDPDLYNEYTKACIGYDVD